MRIIQAPEITKAVRKLCIEANYILGSDIITSIESALKTESSPTGQNILKQLIDNANIAAKEEVPLCQDTGFAVFFVELGQEVHIDGGYLEDAINEGVRQGYTEGYLRKSIVDGPFSRVNTNDNTPALIHTRIVKGNKLKIIFSPKGGGSENMSSLVMLKPAQGVEGVKDFVLETVKRAGPNPCPPIIVGVGIGGTFEKAAIIAKEALLREVGTDNEDSYLNQLEQELLVAINNLGIGPQGFGGNTSALAVHIKTYPTHIACLPVAVNISCHSTRHKEIEL